MIFQTAAKLLHSFSATFNTKWMRRQYKIIAIVFMQRQVSSFVDWKWSTYIYLELCVSMAAIKPFLIWCLLPGFLVHLWICNCGSKRFVILLVVLILSDCVYWTIFGCDVLKSSVLCPSCLKCRFLVHLHRCPVHQFWLLCSPNSIN